MRKTIAIVANSSWNIYNFRQALIKALQHAGYDVLLLAPIDKWTPHITAIPGCRFIPLPACYPGKISPLKDIRLFWFLYRLYRKERPSLVLHHTIKPNVYGSLAARFAGIPSIATLTGLGYAFIHRGWLSQIARLLYKVALQKVDQVVFHNPDDQRLFVQQQLAPAKRCRVIQGSGVDTNYFRPSSFAPKGPFRFTFIGRLLYDKGIEEFVEAAKKFKAAGFSAEFAVVGPIAKSNPAAIKMPVLRQWIDQGLISYYGSSNDVRQHIHHSSVLVLPSYREGLPRAVIEAMAMGKPIITTNTAGCRETVMEGENGFLVEVKDIQDLTQKMELIYQLPESIRNEMGKASRTMAVEYFSDKKIIQQYHQVVLEILGGGRIKKIPARRERSAVL